MLTVIGLWIIGSLVAVDITIGIWRIKKMQEITDALAALSTAISNLQSRAGGVVSQAQATAIASSIRQAASTIDSVLAPQ